MLISQNFYIPGNIHKRKKNIQLGVILGVILGVPKSAPGLRGPPGVTFDLYFTYATYHFGGSRFERKWLTPEMTPKIAQLVSPASQKRINQILDIFLYIFVFCDSK